ncbi:MAG TPA: archaemetzincin family Zn-dependent metalloprotease [Acidobacteriota bacterium]|jgi:archaemetzincin
MLTPVVIHPFDKIPPGLAEAVRSAIHERFKIHATVGKSLAVPAAAYSPERKQYRSTFLLNMLAIIEPGDKKTRLGMVSVDLYVPELNFVFGEASKSERIAVFSTARLDPRLYGEPADQDLLERRAVTEAIHELGHAFGLEHCSRTDCVMWFSNTLSESDRKGSQFCSRCSRLLGY